MSEQYTKVEVIQRKLTGEDWISLVFQALFSVALKTLILWWLVATWFPQYGWTYWQLVLPVFTISLLFGHSSWKPRRLK